MNWTKEVLDSVFSIVTRDIFLEKKVMADEIRN